MSKSWPSVRLGEVLKPRVLRVAIDPVATYKEVTVRLWGKGVIERRTATGAAIVATGRYRVKFRDFVLSKIDARNGALGIVPESLDGALVSGDFPVFEANQTRLLPEYIGWLCKTAGFVESCRQASEGTTNRVRLKLDRFLSSEIPLPPLDEQQRIVAYLDALSAKITQARTLRQQATEEAEALVHSAMTKLVDQAGWAVKRLSVIAEINPSRAGNVRLSPNDEVSFVPMKAVDDIAGTIAWQETKAFGEVSRGYTWFRDGDVIFARITPCMQNGKAALARNLVNGIGFGSTEFHVLRAGDGVSADWLYHLVRHKAFRDDAARHFKGTAGQQRVPQSFLEEKLVPVPPLVEQRRIIEILDALQAKVDALKRAQAEAATELDALQSAALDCAFKGEL